MLVVQDDDPRGEALAAALRATGAPIVVVPAGDPAAAAPHPDALVVIATSAATAGPAALAAVEGGDGTIPVLLAPWLLDGTVIGELADARAPVLVSVVRDPTAAEAVDYRRALGRTPGGGWGATAAGFEAYLSALEALAGLSPGDTAPGVFSAGRLAVLPPSLEQGHGPGSGWAPGLAMARVA